MKWAYYNEKDSYAAEWLRELIKAGLIMQGEVDERDIRDVRPYEVSGFMRCHFFAGIGIWDAALNQADWPVDRKIWTGSAPCQPFSAAGFAGGFADERHLWPSFYHLIAQCRPATIVGEQVASPLGLRWYDLVSSDLEAAGYACGASDLCAAGIAVAAGESQVGNETLEWIRRTVQSCPDPVLAAELRDYAAWFDREAGVGASHIRQRLYWVANSESQHDGRRDSGETRRFESSNRRAVGPLAHADGRHALAEGLQRGGQHGFFAQDGSAGALADSRQRDGIAGGEGRECNWPPPGWQQGDGKLERGSETGVVGDSHDARLEIGSIAEVGRGNLRIERPTATPTGSQDGCDWIVCTDGKARPVESGTFPLAHGDRSRVGRLRAYGNALHKKTAVEFVRTVMELD